MKRPLFALATLLLGTTSALAEVPKVVATIKPIHALVAAVMGDLGQPTLIVKGAASPHTYSLKPSEAGAIEAADIVFWTGHGMEVFLEDSLSTLAPNATSVELSEAPGVELLPVREGGMFEPHEDESEAGHEDHDHAEHAHEGHDHGEMDMHVFLDPQVAKAMVAEIARTLSAADPANAATYAANADAETAALSALEADIAARVAPIQSKPFVVFHDAYQYFAKRFGLNVVGSITVNPENMPGADRIAEVREKLKTLDTACVFAEPQFDPRIVDVLIEGTQAGKSVLDPEGANLPEGKGLYPALLNAMADSIVDCLEK
ncbi:zinc ABC transporter substrate-binding protein [Devosia sp.]|jgi:zinc transport system substrate-binding protein|uniref:zinc ABC transporter substrate-binding protein n=1 Tax=Devosia sp. TaxID=1871048 RepID=UPI0037BF8565